MDAILFATNCLGALNLVCRGTIAPLFCNIYDQLLSNAVLLSHIQCFPYYCFLLFAQCLYI